MKKLLFLVGLFALSTAVQAQTQPAVKISTKPLTVSEVETPQFQAPNVGEKRWRPRKWLEVDLEFEIRLPAAEGGRRGSLDSLTINYFIGLNHQTKDGKYEVLKGSFEYVNIPAGETCHALAFVSPATLRNILQKDNFTAGSDMKAWGFEVRLGNDRIAGESSTGSPWWEKPDNLAIIDGGMLSKQETPFAILWGDYDVMAKKK